MTDSIMSAVNVYLVRDVDGYVLVDCGLEVDESRAVLEDGLRWLGATPDAIHTVVVTHGHHDHFGLAEHLHREHGARVWLHESDLAYIRHRYGDPDSFRGMQREWLVRYGMPEEIARSATRMLGVGTQAVSVAQPDRVLQGGETLDVADLHFEIHWTPGHTPGHVVLVEPREQLLFAGDHILPNANANVSLQPYSTANPLPGYLASLEYLATLPMELAMPGHGDLMPSVAERARQIAGHQIARREQLLGLLTEAPQTPYELAAQVWGSSKSRPWSQFADNLRRNAVTTLVAHLELMVDEGQARRVEDGAVRFAATV